MVYDGAGRLVETTSTTTREPEFDEVDRAMFDELRNYREDLHVCGRPLSESLHDVSLPNDQQVRYTVGTDTCRACMALDKRQAERRSGDTKLVELGRSPDSWRLDRVMTVQEAEALIAAGEATESS